jgi:hypothetical protein
MMRLRLGERFLQQLPLAEIHCPITANCVLSSRRDGYCPLCLAPIADIQREKKAEARMFEVKSV